VSYTASNLAHPTMTPKSDQIDCRMASTADETDMYAGFHALDDRRSRTSRRQWRSDGQGARGGRRRAWRWRWRCQTLAARETAQAASLAKVRKAFGKAGVTFLPHDGKAGVGVHGKIKS
jgi:hypothetical protein